ncbi:MAG: GNAT family N-acetyltransferase [Candidatus Marinimicrobia bacterium]|nr:GNAT family N-acetyltransferase [Candidatus Neomarinimicrobiota bacterium]
MDLSRQTIQNLIDGAEKNVVDVNKLISIAQQLLQENTERKTIHTFLNLGHLPSVNSTISENNLVNDWLDLLIKLIVKSRYSLGHLFYNRSNKYKHKVLFHEFHNGKVVNHTYEEIWEELIKTAGALIQFEKPYSGNMRIGILTPNCLRGAVIDLTCLSFHFPVIPIPANSNKNDIDFIIKHSGITHLFIDEELHAGLKDILIYNHNKITIVNLNEKEWHSFIENGKKSNPLDVLKRIGRANMEDIATIMYTSGTTGEPKGITFTQKNMITKRFARALALTKLGPQDIFLSYLPLYHTFGRFLELQGSIFWGASYTFAENSSFDALRKNFSKIKPSIFISVPKRWTQLYDAIQSLAADHLDENLIVRKAIKMVTGGNLKWGLSAAGYLDPDIFQFFQNNEVQLLSGYGMTEATGGITMTYPNKYTVDSVGQQLPGIDLRISDDGELLLKGPYLSSYYYNDPLISSTVDGWFHTGDIFMEKDGHYFIKDRKKEIYKNAAGQTLTPQKIENMLSEFDAIQSAFLVGDQMNFNTVLIYPDEEYLKKHIPSREPTKIRAVVSALIQSVNGFLSPFERIVNFGVIPRDFSADKDELTQKGTFKRNNILENWADIIKPMYAPNQTNIKYKGKMISFPNWLVKTMNIVSQDISWSGRYLKNDTLGLKCKCQWQNETLVLGEFKYQVSSNNVDLGKILMDPVLWLGNNDLTNFFGDVLFRLSPYKNSSDVQLLSRKSFQPTQSQVNQTDFDESATIEDIHMGTMLLIQNQQNGLDYFNHVFAQKDLELKKLGVQVLKSMLEDSELKISRLIFNTLIPHLYKDQFISPLKNLFKRHQKEKKLRSFNFDITQLDVKHVNALIKELISHRTQEDLSSSEQAYVRMLMSELLKLAHIHPAQYTHIRHELTCWKLLSSVEALGKTAANCLTTLIKHFKEMIGEVDVQSVDPETGSEYSWSDILEFDNVIPNEEKEFLLKLFQSHPIVREAIFLITGYKLLHLENIPKKGIWITPMISNIPIQHYRILTTLKDGNSYNFIINHFPESSKIEIENMGDWQIVKSTGLMSMKVTNDYLCSYPKSRIIISEYDTKANVAAYLRHHEKELNNPKLRDRWDMHWLHFGWSGLQCYIDHWAMTNFQYTLIDPSIKNVVVSEFDYVTNVRIIHSFYQEPVKSNLDFMTKLYSKLIIDTEKRFKGLNHVLNWDVVFTCIMQAMGKEKGLVILNQIADEVGSKNIHELNHAHLNEYISEVKAYGYIPKSVIFAALRFQRWMDLNPEATIESQCNILQEMYNDYRLNTINTSHPEVRLRYFLLTCFADHETFVAQRLFELSSQLHHHEIESSELDINIHALVKEPNCSEEDVYFLTRLIYEHVDSADYAELITRATGQKKLDLAVNVKNDDGRIFTIRPPFKPKEIANFYDLLLSYDLSTQFGEDHDFLIVFSANKAQVGGVFWKMIDKNTAHLEKIAIHKKFAKSGLGDLLMNEMIHRVKKSGMTYLTVGLMETEFIQRFGFKEDESISEYVKEL